MKSSLTLLQAFCLVLLSCGQTSNWKNNQASHRRNPPLSRSRDNGYFAQLQEDMNHFRQALNNILIPRVPGTEGSRRVRNFIVNEMTNLGWSVEVDNFRQQTVVGDVEFNNVIATLDPAAPRRLILACHYDSKREPKNFLGATDSAVPCAQMINLAHVMHMDLRDSKQRQHEVTLQLLFLDGEEAFVRWTDDDSIYGARHLAAKWQKQRQNVRGIDANNLDRIDVFVLLDLLGAKNPKISSLDDKVHPWFLRLRGIESQLISAGIVQGPRVFQSSGPQDLGIADDHLPFLRRGVPVLHLIAAPFPRVWHKSSDNLNAVDFPTVEKLNKILRLFVRDYLQIP